MTEELVRYFNNDELAINVWQSKYAKEGDITPDDMHRRMAKQFGRIEEMYVTGEDYEKNEGEKMKLLSSYGQSRPHLFEDDIYNLFKDFKYIVPQGSIMDILGTNKIGSLSNCFVIGQPDDSYGGIFQKDEEMAQLEKRRGGVGIDISTLRPSGTSTTNAAKTSTGAVSFMNRFSNTTNEVAQNGRRGALMISIDINHPDVMDFIKIKRDLTKVTGANISIKLNDEFMKAVEADEDYILTFPCNIKDIDWGLYDIADFKELQYNQLYSFSDNTHYKRIKAKEYWDEIIKSAHGVAEPGLMFWDNMVNYSPDGAYDQFRQVTTNPCSEIGMQPYDACRLIAVNLFSFVENPFTDDAKFDFNKFYSINYEAMRLSDDLVDLEMEHIDRIINKINLDPEDTEIKYRELRLWHKVKATAQASRRTGLGFTALGDTLAALGVAYDSKEALIITETIMQYKLRSELDCTTDLAILRGTFEGWNPSKEFGTREGDYYQIGDAPLFFGNNPFYDMLTKDFPKEAQRMYQYGRRNVSWSTVAPTGTVSIMTQTTSGIEPLFMPFYMRRKKVMNEGDKVDFTDELGVQWTEFAVLHPKFQDWLESGIKGIKIEELTKDQLEQNFVLSPWYKSTANDIDWVKRVEIQSVIQKYITHSISSTINLPKDVSLESVSEIYLQSWKKGLKGITVYRDGSRSGVLVSGNESKKEQFNYYDSPKRPKELEADYYYVTSKGRKYAVIVGLLEGKPYEIFAFEDPINKDNLRGKIIKVKKGVYMFESERYTIDNLQLSSEYSDEKLLTRWISLALRHGANPKFIIEQTEKSEVEITAFSKVISRVLKKYIPDGEKSTTSCRDCGSDNVVFEEGCQTCKSCGSSKCS